MIKLNCQPVNNKVIYYYRKKTHYCDQGLYVQYKYCEADKTLKFNYK